MYNVSLYLILIFGLLPFSLRTVTLMLGFENTYREQEKRLSKLSRKSDRKQVKSSYFRVRATMCVVTILYWVAISIATIGLLRILQGGIMVTKIGKAVGAVLGTLTLGLILYVSIGDFLEAKSERDSNNDSGDQDKNSGAPKGKGKREAKRLSLKIKTNNCKVKEPTYVKIPVPMRETPVSDIKRDVPRSTVETVGDTSVINIEKLGFTTTAPREPFFKKSDAAEKFLATVKELYREDPGMAQA